MDGRWQMAERGVKPLGLVSLFDEPWQLLAHHVAEALVAGQVDLFDLERLHEAVSLGVVIRIARRTHRYAQTESVDAGLAHGRLMTAAAAGALLETAMASQQIGVLARLVRRITVRKDSIGIEVRVASIWSAEAVPSDEDEEIALIEVPVQLKRCGMAVRLIVRPAGESATRGVDAKLVALISKAHDWFERLSSGRCDSAQAIAQQEQIASSSYVTRVI